MKGFLNRHKTPKSETSSEPSFPQKSHKSSKKSSINSDYFTTIFESADRDKSGTLTKAEFQNCFQSLGLHWSEDFEVEFNSWDVNGDGQVSYEG